MLFHIGCTGRSGSVYAYKMLMQMGLPTLHEKPSERPYRGKGLKYVQAQPRIFRLYKGTIGWRWEIDCPNIVSKAKHKFFMVRDPIDVLKSAVTHNDTLYDAVEAHIGTKYSRCNLNSKDYKLTRAVNYWLGYLDTFAAGREILKVEEFVHEGKALNIFCEIVGIPKVVTALAVPKDEAINTRAWTAEYNKHALSDLKNADPELFEILLERRVMVGYSATAET